LSVRVRASGIEARGTVARWKKEQTERFFTGDQAIPTASNQNPEQLARDNIDKMLEEAGWKVQHNKKIDFNAGPGIAVREYQTDAGPTDYALFVDRRAVGVIEAKPEDWGHKITTVEEQSSGYAAAKFKWVNNKEPLPFVYESTGVITRFTDSRDPNPRSHEVFTFHRPETLAEWISKPKSLRARLHDIPALNTAGLRDCQIADPKS
jgi:type I restriction enzyme, R subunit